MTPDSIKPLIPGIRAIFATIGLRAEVAATKSGEVQVSLFRSGERAPLATKTFSEPRLNWELSLPLIAWRDELKATGRHP